MKFAGAYIDEQKHKALRELAKGNHRTLADECRRIYDEALNGTTVAKTAARKPKGPRR